MPLPLAAVAAVAAASTTPSLSMAAIAAISSSAVIGTGLLGYLGVTYLTPEQQAAKKIWAKKSDEFTLEIDRIEKNIRSLTEVVEKYQANETLLKAAFEEMEDKLNELNKANQKLAFICAKQERRIAQLINYSLEADGLRQQVMVLHAHQDRLVAAMDKMHAHFEKLTAERDDAINVVDTLKQLLAIEIEQKQRLKEQYEEELSMSAALQRHNVALEEENIELMDLLSQQPEAIGRFGLFAQAETRGQEDASMFGVSSSLTVTP